MCMTRQRRKRYELARVQVPVQERGCQQHLVYLQEQGKDRSRGLQTILQEERVWVLQDLKIRGN